MRTGTKEKNRKVQVFIHGTVNYHDITMLTILLLSALGLSSAPTLLTGIDESCQANNPGAVLHQLF